MAYCTKCGVEIEDDLAKCPLCGTVIDRGSGARPATQEEEDEGARSLRAKRGHLFAVEVLSVLAGIGAVLCLGIDLWATRGQVGWSLLAVIGIAMAWLLVAMPIVFAGKPWLAFAAIAPSELLLLFLLDVADGSGRIDWFLGVGMPIYLMTLVVLTAAAVLAVVSKRKGLNLLGLALAAATVECLGLESILSIHLGGGFNLAWSPVVALACLPAAGLAFYMHYRVIRKPLRRTFHL